MASHYIEHSHHSFREGEDGASTLAASDEFAAGWGHFGSRPQHPVADSPAGLRRTAALTHAMNEIRTASVKITP
jgi:hypothetical protein